MRRKVRIIRWWMLFCAAVAIGLYDPVLLFGALPPLGILPCSDCCADGPCGACSGGNRPEEFQVDADGFADDYCTGCSKGNRSAVVAHSTDNCGIGNPCCQWTLTDTAIGGSMSCPSDCCTSCTNSDHWGSNVFVYLKTLSSQAPPSIDVGHYIVRVSVGFSGLTTESYGGGGCIWYKDMGTSAPGCTSLSAEAINTVLFAENCFDKPGSVECGSSPTVEITAL